MVLWLSQWWLQPFVFLSWQGIHEWHWGSHSGNNNKMQTNLTPYDGRTTATTGYPHFMAGTGSRRGPLPRCLADHSIAQQRWPWTLEQDASRRHHLIIRSCCPSWWIWWMGNRIWYKNFHDHHTVQPSEMASKPTTRVMRDASYKASQTGWCSEANHVYICSHTNAWVFHVYVKCHARVTVHQIPRLKGQMMAVGSHLLHSWTLCPPSSPVPSGWMLPMSTTVVSTHHLPVYLPQAQQDCLRAYLNWICEVQALRPCRRPCWLLPTCQVWCGWFHDMQSQEHSCYV